MRAVVLSFEGAASFEGGETIVGPFDSEMDAMSHGDTIVAFDCVYVREFDGTTVLRSWRKAVVRGVVQNWVQDARPNAPYVSYRRESMDEPKVDIDIMAPADFANVAKQSEKAAERMRESWRKIFALAAEYPGAIEIIHDCVRVVSDDRRIHEKVEAAFRDGLS